MRLHRFNKEVLPCACTYLAIELYIIVHMNIEYLIKETTWVAPYVANCANGGNKALKLGRDPL